MLDTIAKEEQVSNNRDSRQKGIEIKDQTIPLNVQTISKPTDLKYEKQIKDYEQKGAPHNLARQVVAKDLQLARISRQKERYKELTLIDPLTGLYNKRWLFGDNADINDGENNTGNPSLKGNLKRLMSVASRLHVDLCVIAIDMDNFKAVNDKYGHISGDEVLKAFASLINNGETRKSDYPVRIGGDEFVVVSEGTKRDGGLAFAERIRQEFERNKDFKKYGVTISLGVASFPHIGISSDHGLVDAADMAMYKSKENGKNRITVWENEIGIKSQKNEDRAFINEKVATS